MSGLNFNRRTTPRPYNPHLGRETHSFPEPERVPSNVLRRPVQLPPMRRIKDS